MCSGIFSQRALTTVWIAGAVLALAMPALAQTGRIQGKVTDDNNAAVAGAKIVVTAVPDQGGQKWEATSDKNGNYIIGTLPKSGGPGLHSERWKTMINRRRRAERPPPFRRR